MKYLAKMMTHGNFQYQSIKNDNHLSVPIGKNPYLNSAHSEELTVFREHVLRMGTDRYGVPRKSILQSKIRGS